MVKVDLIHALAVQRLVFSFISLERDDGLGRSTKLAAWTMVLMLGSFSAANAYKEDFGKSRIHFVSSFTFPQHVGNRLGAANCDPHSCVRQPGWHLHFLAKWECGPRAGAVTRGFRSEDPCAGRGRELQMVRAWMR